MCRAFDVFANQQFLVELLTRSLQAADTLRGQHLYVTAIRYPSVARGAARLRVTLTAAHTPDDVVKLVAALNLLTP